MACTKCAMRRSSNIHINQKYSWTGRKHPSKEQRRTRNRVDPDCSSCHRCCIQGQARGQQYAPKMKDKQECAHTGKKKTSKRRHDAERRRFARVGAADKNPGPIWQRESLPILAIRIPSQNSAMAAPRRRSRDGNDAWQKRRGIGANKLPFRHPQRCDHARRRPQAKVCGDDSSCGP